jgi:hypothetical protein
MLPQITLDTHKKGKVIIYDIFSEKQEKIQ